MSPKSTGGADLNLQQVFEVMESPTRKRRVLENIFNQGYPIWTPGQISAERYHLELWTDIAQSHGSKYNTYFPSIGVVLDPDLLIRRDCANQSR